MTNETESNFKVTDRRKFNSDGTLRDPSELPEEPAAATTGPAENVSEPAPEVVTRPESAVGSDNVVSFPGEQGKKKETTAPEPPTAQTAREPKARAGKGPSSATSGIAENAYAQASSASPSRQPEASFSILVNMLGFEAAIRLGMIESPMEGSAPVDLDSARHFIDMLGMLEQKTRGNLTPEEDNLLENILADLRMQYVALSKRK